MPWSRCKSGCLLCRKVQKCILRHFCLLGGLYA
nr:MAG TPA: hypothetical protein [Caudoviricetes sp.]